MDLNQWKKFVFMLAPKSSVFSWVKDRFLTALFYSAGEVASDVSDHNGQNFTDAFPNTTTRADDWSSQFNSPITLSASQLSFRHQESGGQSPHYLQTRLHGAGLTNLYVHEWWVPGSDPVAARDPFVYINNYQPNNLLVNPVVRIYDDVPQCGDRFQCGDDLQCGDSEGLKYEEKIYSHPDIEEEKPFYFYVCGETFGENVTLSEEDLAMAKHLIYKIKPAHLRCVLIANADLWINTPYTGDEVWINTPYTGDEIYINIGDR